MQPAELDIELRRCNHALLNRHTEEGWNDTQYHHSRSEHDCKHVFALDLLHARSSLLLRMWYACHDDLLIYSLRLRGSCPFTPFLASVTTAQVHHSRASDG